MFPLTQILREIINVNGDFTSSKIAVLTFSEALNFDFAEFLQHLRVKIHQKKNSEPLEMVKIAIFEALKPSKIDFT